MKAIKETEKAIMLEMIVSVRHGKEFSKNVWIPKSQIKDEIISDWIAQQKIEDALDFPNALATARFFDDDGEEVKVSSVVKKENFNDKYERLFKIAQENKIEVKWGASLSCITKKLVAAGINI